MIQSEVHREIIYQWAMFHIYVGPLDYYTGKSVEGVAEGWKVHDSGFILPTLVSRDNLKFAEQVEWGVGMLQFYQTC